MFQLDLSRGARPSSRVHEAMEHRESATATRYGMEKGDGNEGGEGERSERGRATGRDYEWGREGARG
jgi:hypothetical protein